jgi:hypothetical protein
MGDCWTMERNEVMILAPTQMNSEEANQNRLNIA